jgi:hypothetical protein
MKKIILFTILLLSVSTFVFSQDYSVFLYQKKGSKIFTTEKNGNHNFTMFLKNLDQNQAEKFANSFKGERGVINVELAHSDDNMFKITLTTYKYANTPRYYWFLLKRNKVITIETPQKKYTIDDYFDIHDKIHIKS